MDTSKNSDHNRAASVPDEEARGLRAPGSGLGVRGAARRARAAAFSLVEVTMAIGIMGFAFVAILGMVPLGLNSFRDIKNTAVSSQISQQIVAEVQVASFNQLTQTTGNDSATTVTNSQGVVSSSLRLPAPPETPPSSTPYVRYFSEQGIEVLSTDPAGIYQVNTRVLVGPGFVQTAATAMGVGNGGVAGVTVQVACNPGRLTLDMDAHDPCLWSTTGRNLAVPLYHVETTVARNF